MVRKALIVWSLGTLAAGGAGWLAYVSALPSSSMAAARPAEVHGAGSGPEAPPALVALSPPDLPGPLTIDVPAVAEPPTGRLVEATVAEALFGPPSSIAAPFGIRPAFADAHPGIRATELSAPAPVPAPLGDVVRAVAARDTTLSRLAVLPPPRPAFPEAKLLPEAAASAAIVELRPQTASAAWSEAGLNAPAWPMVAAAPAGDATLSGKPERALQAGMASWYGPGFHGRKTASGEVFNQNALTAAHRYLPFGTRVKVVDPKTGRSVVVRINDRGPFAHGRVIDLSKASAEALGIGGLARVQIVSAE